VRVAELRLDENPEVCPELEFLGEREEELPMPAPDRIAVARLGESLGRVLADRLEHRESIVPVTDEALIDQELERVEVGVCDLFRRSRACSRRERRTDERTAAAPHRLAGRETTRSARMMRERGRGYKMATASLRGERADAVVEFLHRFDLGVFGRFLAPLPR